MTPATGRPARVEQAGNLRIFTFEGGPIRDIQNRLSRELEGRTDGLDGCHLMLDFTNVESVGSEELGTIIRLHRKMNSGGGLLTLFNVRPQVFDAFAVTRLDTLVRVCREVADDRRHIECRDSSPC